MATVRPATPADAPILMGMIRELAEFEKMPESVKVDEETLAADIERNAFGGFLAQDESGEYAGMLLYYFGYSTWLGQFMHMEDLYVKPAFRKNGYAKMLWMECAKLSRSLGHRRFQWDVLDWNVNAINFYKKVKSTQDLTHSEGWLKFRLDEEGIAEEHAEFEKIPESVKLDEATLAADIERNAVGGFLAQDESGEYAGMLVYHFGYSTWLGQFMHMEDLYVKPEFRKNGHAKKLWMECAKLSRSLGHRRFEWGVMDWNINAINFYKKVKSTQDLTHSEGWLKFRLDGEGIAEVADGKF